MAIVRTNNRVIGDKPVISVLPEDLAKQMKETGVWKESSPVSLQRLSLVEVPYVDFKLTHDNGEIIVFDAYAKKVAQVFAKLFKLGFPINKIRSLHHYSANDELSMADNNTSCFCDRPISKGLPSMHCYGMALDINPLQNPFVVFNEKAGKADIYPQKGWQFLNRHNQKEGMVEPIVSLLAKHGFFIWGGHWTTPIDFHHFQPQRGIAELLVILSKTDGERLIELAIKERHRLTSLDSFPYGEKLQPLKKLYKKNKTDFFERFCSYIR
jgi:hypothetical protein